MISTPQIKNRKAAARYFPQIAQISLICRRQIMHLDLGKKNLRDQRDLREQRITEQKFSIVIGSGVQG
jgi:hypothetical protein